MKFKKSMELIVFYAKMIYFYDLFYFFFLTNIIHNLEQDEQLESQTVM